MNTTCCLLFAALALTACEENESLIRPEAAAEIARNAGKAEAERVWTGQLALERMQVDISKKAVLRATDAGERALAVEDLRQANDDVREIEERLRKLDE